MLRCKDNHKQILAVIIVMSLLYTLTTISLAEAVSAAEQDDSMGQGNTYYSAASQTKKDSPGYLYILNTGEEDARAVITLHYEEDISNAKTVMIGKQSLIKIDLSAYDKTEMPFAIKVRSEKPLVVEKVQYDSANSAGYTATADGLKEEWYFAEGYSTGSAKTILHMFNPSRKSGEAQVTVYADDGSKKAFNLELPRDRLLSLDMKEEVYSQKRYGIKIESDLPIFAEAENSNKLMSGGTGSKGGEVSKSWYLADGYVSDQATDFLNILNPTLKDAEVKVTVLSGEGPDLKENSFKIEVPHLMKKHVMLNNRAELEKEYSLKIESDADVVVELTHHDERHDACHGGLGAVEPGKEWAFAAGNSEDTNYLAVLNPGENTAMLEVLVYHTDGTVEKIEKVARKGRSTIKLDEIFSDDRDYGITVKSSEPIVVENVVYNKKYDAGYSTYGTSKDVGIVEIETESEEEETEKITGEVVKEEPKLALLEKKGYPGNSFGLEGLVEADKITYEYDQKKIILWEFYYSRETTAKQDLQDMLSGELIDVKEYSRIQMEELDMYTLIAEDSQGYAWQEKDSVKVALAKDKEDAMRVVEFAMQPDRKGFWSWKIMLFIVLGLLILWWIAKRFRKKEEDFDWEELEDVDIIEPDMAEEKKKTAPKKKKTDRKKGNKTKSKEKGKKKEKKEKKKPEEKKKEETKGDKEKENKKQGKKEKPKDKTHEKKEPSNEKKDDKPDIKIERVDNPSDSFIDSAEDEGEWLNYEDVFRHVNRDGDEIKPK